MIRFHHLLFPLILNVLCVSALYAQHMASVSVTPGVLIPVHTAKTHLTVLDLDSSIEDVAAGARVYALAKQQGVGRMLDV